MRFLLFIIFFINCETFEIEENYVNIISRHEIILQKQYFYVYPSNTSAKTLRRGFT